MSDENKKNAAVAMEEDHTPPPSDPSQVLSPKRRSALVTYLAILFAIAFLFVALTMALESKRLKSANEALEDKNQQTSASLTGSINALQDENHKLIDNNQELAAQVAALELRLQNAESSAAQKTEEFNAQLEKLQQEKQALETEKAELKKKNETLTKQAHDAIAVSELLQKAIALNDEGDNEGLAQVLAQIAPMKELLSATELELYESLVVD